MTEPRTFDDTARALAAGVSRRDSLRVLSAALAGAVAASLEIRPDAASGRVAAGASDSHETAKAACRLPKASAGCVKLGGGVRPYYVEGWVCPSTACPKKLCSGRRLGRKGKCGVTARQLRKAVAKGEMRVLAGTLP